ncbi:phosphoribosylaminoimidazolesuccinocarboxamide synthase [Halolamina litorea]|uniref:Phosphoribosylaminoimidazole-succinocarboxamide synthase n=1 Tax=Halolamina litorea TaxID=1515593 RepID=A0ABD6BVC4_9EURY|nr:phosphoribosylaminoimidazolesuccinocarboxamide synthase [Halolamina litorea]
MTSVKEFRVDREPTDDELGRGRFVFTDDYSVFDWGRMPDRIPEKGRSLCTMGADNFERLADAGVPTHYRGVVSPDDAGSDAPPTYDLDAVSGPPRQMAIDLTVVPDLPHGADGYDYDQFHASAGSHYLVPLEIVFRNEVPIGSSLRARKEPEDVGLDRHRWPDEAVSLPEPIVEFSTKFEEQDRYLDDDAAAEIAGRADLDDLRETALAVNEVITERAAETGFVHEDGKIECLWVDGEVRVADVAGTFDENRFAYDGQELSKEVLRQFYKGYDPDWVAAVKDAKAVAEAEGVADWKSFCEESPEPLPADVREVAGEMYAAGTNAYTGREWFEAPAIEDAVDAVRDL